jgi:hypothetical protein
MQYIRHFLGERARTWCIILFFHSFAEYERLDAIFVEAVGILSLAYSPSAERELGPSRYVICWWSVFAMLVTTAYSCGLASRLTLPQNNPPLDSVKDLVEAGFHWGHTYLPTVDIIFDKNVHTFNTYCIYQTYFHTQLPELYSCFMIIVITNLKEQ